MTALTLDRRDGIRTLDALYRAGETDLAERLAPQLARFQEGDEVRWYESAVHPHNRGEIQELMVLGFPEVTDGIQLAYEVEFPGANGSGLETHTVLERDLVPYGTPEENVDEWREAG